ncbi:hypothetical protein [Psychrobacter arcticus]|uniref:hypothetical protein n=1 Tax=Psychrobacter arcticus TaxID=334543 RepID=UPI0005A1C019|nr:hypothetical protein [Psychrobacter arcticus]
MQSVPALAIQMDMATYYGMPELELKSAGQSSISTANNIKPSPNNLPNKLAFKFRRLVAQINIGLIQAKYSRKSDYLEVLPKYFKP